MEKELLGILKALEFIRNMLLTSRVIIFTDNKNKINNNDLSRRCQSMKLMMEEFNYELKGIEGKRNNIADNISRLNVFIPTEMNSYWNTKYENLNKNAKINNK
ncbi:Retrovirus-related Pol polyprotein from transposon 17.6 [Dictyocoela muelleri]|nr:Retrovirus-related Pol polyprotein from transposon 17.6 [Dictyocoela muelleri]